MARTVDLFCFPMKYFRHILLMSFVLMFGGAAREELEWNKDSVLSVLLQNASGGFCDRLLLQVKFGSAPRKLEF